MIILSHRGYWKDAREKNSVEAFVRSFDLGFGTETDVRDCGGKIVIAHDMPTGTEPTLAELLRIMNGRNLPLAINIKADGLAEALNAEMRQARHTNWFTFDMSVPDMLAQLQIGLPVFTRASEFELTPPCYESAIGVWLDAFKTEWYTSRDIQKYLDEGKRVCIVSPELHRRDPKSLWNSLARSSLASHPGLMICTDLPEDVDRIFGGTA